MTKLDIINKALLRVGQRPLQSVDEDSNDARLVNILFDSTVEETLREGAFNSTIKRTQLVQTPTSPLFGYANSFQVPVDAIRILNCFDSRGEYNPHLYWEIEGDLVLSNADALYCKYIIVPDDLSVLDPLGARAVSLQLALQLAYPKTESQTLVSTLTNEYEQLMLQKAKSFSSMEANKNSNFSEPDWVESRNASWS